MFCFCFKNIHVFIALLDILMLVFIVLETTVCR